MKEQKLCILSIFKCLCSYICQAVHTSFLGASLVVQMVKNLPAMQETWVQPLGREDPLEKEMATHSSILAWTEEPGGLQSIVWHGVGHN